MAVQWPYSGRHNGRTVAVSKNIRNFVYYSRATAQGHIHTQNKLFIQHVPETLLFADGHCTATVTATVRPLYGHCTVTVKTHARWQHAAGGMKHTSVSTYQLL